MTVEELDEILSDEDFESDYGCEKNALREIASPVIACKKRIDRNG